MSRWWLVLLLSLLSLALGCSHSSSATRPAGDSPLRQQQRALEELRSGTELLENGKYEDAEKHLTLALRIDGFSGLGHNNLGKVYYEQGRFYDAAWQFQYAAKLLPNHPEPRNNLGLVLETTGKLDEAIAQYQQARILQPENPQYLGNLARAHVRRGDRDEATRTLLLDLVEKETRPDWRQWAQRELATHYLAAKPATVPHGSAAPQ